MFGRLDDYQLMSGHDAFHMWLQTETHTIDFMAPIYREAFSEHPSAAILPRKMIQRPLTDEAESLDALKQPGDFRYYPDAELTDQLLDSFLGKQANADLLQIVVAWYGNRRGKQSPSFAMTDEKGRTTRLPLAGTVATGSW